MQSTHTPQFLGNAAPLLKTFALGLATLAALGLGAAHPAHAQAVFTAGNNPQSNEENVLLNNGQVGTTVSGTTQTSGLTVLFDSTQTLTAPSNGQARVQTNSGGALNNVTISLADGGTFTDLLANPFIGGAGAPNGGTLNGSAMTSGGTFNFSYAIGKGSNFFTLVADPGVTISSVQLSGTSFTDLRQIRISGAAPAITAAPEPSSVALLGLGAVGLILTARKRKAVA